MERERLRKIAEVGVVAATYAALVLLFAPISFAAVQFRVAEVLKSAVIFRPHLIWAMAIGVGVANLMSPFGGPWELLWMPAMNLVGGYGAWLLGTRLNPYVGAAFFAAWISLAVAVMLFAAAGLPFLPTLGSVLISELILVVGGVPVMRWVMRRVEDVR